jgi:tetratricopeptide (TPR) repeat protein
MRLINILALCPVLILGKISIASSEGLISQGELAYMLRSEGHVGATARPEPIERAIDIFSEALEQDPENRTARWMLLRCLYFKAEYVIEDEAEKLALFEVAIELADVGREQLLAKKNLIEDPESLTPEEIAEALRDEPEAAEIYFWSAAHWGLWGKYRGKIAAARQGVATRVRDYAEVTALLNETLEEAGGHRILGRLHSEAPRLPFVTGWVNHDEAVARLERAAELDPDALLTKLFLAEALLEHQPSRRAEALSLLEAVAVSKPDPAMVIEETKTIEDARVLLVSIRR